MLSNLPPQILIIGGVFAFMATITALAFMSRPHVIRAKQVDSTDFVVRFRKWWFLGTFTVRASMLKSYSGRYWQLYDITTKLERAMSENMNPHYYAAFYRYLHKTYGSIDPEYFDHTSDLLKPERKTKTPDFSVQDWPP